MKKGTIIGIIVGVIVALMLIVFLFSISTVPTGYVGVKTRFGAVQEEMINEGFNLKAPFIESVKKIDCRIQKAEVDASAASKDLQTVTIKIAVNYNVNKDTANQLFKEVGLAYKEIIIDPAVMESVKAVTAQYTAEELITKRAKVSNEMTDTLVAKIKDRGFTVVEFNVIDLDFSAEYNKAIEEKQVAEQQVKKASQELAKAKIENEKKVANAKAEAEVMKLQNKEITEKTLNLKRLEVQEQLIKKWDGKLPTYNMGDSIPMFNINQ